MATLVPSFEGSIPTTIQTQEKFIPYFANVNPEQVDSTMLTASSPDSAFASMSTKELMELSR